MRNVHDCAFLLDFTLKIKELLKCSEEIFLFEFLLQNTKVHFPPIRIVCPYDVELVTTSKNLWIKVLYWSAATNSKWLSEVNVIFLLVYEFHELLLRFDGENRRKWQRCDHRSLFPSPSRITSRLLRRLECVAWRIVASHCAGDARIDTMPSLEHVQFNELKKVSLVNVLFLKEKEDYHTKQDNWGQHSSWQWCQTQRATACNQQHDHTPQPAGEHDP